MDTVYIEVQPHSSNIVEYNSTQAYIISYTMLACFVAVAAMFVFAKIAELRRKY